jgi:hypothetical protein
MLTALLPDEEIGWHLYLKVELSPLLAVLGWLSGQVG